ncbi:MAG: hypothetical protein WCK15_18425 [Pirellula sp.]
MNRKPSRFPDEGLVGLAILFSQVKLTKSNRSNWISTARIKNSRTQASSPATPVFSERTHYEKE